MTEDVERRYTKVTVELRSGKDRSSIGGYAAMFSRQSKPLGGFVEQIDPGAFNLSRADGWPDVIARYNHDDNMLLGTTAAGTLRLMIDNAGLLYEVEPPQSRTDILELVERGDVRKSSFAFRTVEDDWGANDQGTPLRTLQRVQLVDVAPVNIPAYDDTSAGLRSLANKFGASVDEVRKMAENDELRKFFARTDGPNPKVRRMRGASAAVELLARRESPYS